MYYREYSNNPRMNNYKPNFDGDDRFFFFPFAVPFLLGGLGGAAIASAARPRPVYVTPPPAYPPAPSYGYNYYGGYNYTPAPYQYPYYR